MHRGHICIVGSTPLLQAEELQQLQEQLQLQVQQQQLQLQELEELQELLQVDRIRTGETRDTGKELPVPYDFAQYHAAMMLQQQ